MTELSKWMNEALGTQKRVKKKWQQQQQTGVCFTACQEAKSLICSFQPKTGIIDKNNINDLQWHWTGVEIKCHVLILCRSKQYNFTAFSYDF